MRKVEDDCTELSLEDSLLDTSTRWDRKRVCGIIRSSGRMPNLDQDGHRQPSSRRVPIESNRKRRDLRILWTRKTWQKFVIVKR